MELLIGDHLRNNFTGDADDMVLIRFLETKQ
jgi:hypothetical protein